jgi:hypothetical protein
MATGITFGCLVEALMAGFTVHDETEHGCVVRRRLPSGGFLTGNVDKRVRCPHSTTEMQVAA